MQLEELHSYFPARHSLDGTEGTPPNAAPAHSQFGQLDIQDFNLIEPISRGSFGRVYLAEKKTTKDTYAIKVRKEGKLVQQ
jgi:serine/threonine protein kinase